MPDERSFPEINFVDTDTQTIINALTAAFEHLLGRTLYPASPERLFIIWVASIIVQQRVLINDSARQNVPRYARGVNLDSIAEIFKGVSRLPAQPATTTARFILSAAQPSAVLIPAGSRVTDASQSIVFSTVDDAYVAIGDLNVDVATKCMTLGNAGNGFVAGQISKLVDVFPYYKECANITTSEGGSDVENDSAFYKRMRESEDTYSTAGSKGAYEYFARSANSLISDVKAVSPNPGEVKVYVLLQGGEIPGSEIIAVVEAALDAAEVRPLTDNVEVLAPTSSEFDIALTYYKYANSPIPGAVVDAAVLQAVEDYKAWQVEKMARDINPDELHGRLMQTGIKRLVLTAPTYTVLANGYVASFGNQLITDGGEESE